MYWYGSVPSADPLTLLGLYLTRALDCSSIGEQADLQGGGQGQIEGDDQGQVEGGNQDSDLVD